MSSFVLKLVACLSMLIDHAGLLFLPDEWVPRAIGRIALPLFAFMIAEGFRKTGNPKAYAKRLLIMAVISQIPYSFMNSMAGFDPLRLNILFLLAAGVLLLYLLHRYPSRLAQAALIVACAVTVELAPVEYGAYGITLILCFYVFFRRRLRGVGLFAGATCIKSTATAHVFGLVQIFALLAIPFVWFYNGELGPKRYRAWFYWFYPAHLAALGIVKAILR